MLKTQVKIYNIALNDEILLKRCKRFQNDTSLLQIWKGHKVYL